MEKYIDVKVTTWERYYLKEDENLDRVVQILKKFNSDLNILSLTTEFSETKCLLELNEYMTLEENNDNATVEVYENEKLIWDNRND